jgi:hypothetical protein
VVGSHEEFGMPATDLQLTARYDQCFVLQQTHSGMGKALVATPNRSGGCVDDHYVAGEPITLSAQPSPGHVVASWQGTADDDSLAANNALVMPNSPHAVNVAYGAPEQAGFSFVYLPSAAKP